MPTKPSTKSWSSTLRLPKSKFPPRPSPADQSKYLRRCSDELYEWQSRERSAQKPFVLHDGPPYANGDLHIGHALNKILKDIICRVKVQQGRRVAYVPGWDCHGLPIEIKALEQQRESQRDGEGIIEAIAVRRAARNLASKTVKTQLKGFRAWAIMADWDNSWKTMDKSFEMEQLRVFQVMAREGLIFRRYKPVYWSPSSKTALAEAELEYKDDHVSTAAYVKFPLKGVPDSLRARLPHECQLFAVIWTTTPWTLPANRAIAVHAELEYSVVKNGDEFLLIASARFEALRALLFSENAVEIFIDSIIGSELVDSEYVNSLRGKDSSCQPIIHAEFVTADSGSGLVHLAPGHGMDDYEVCRMLGIEATAPVSDDGCFTAAALPDNPSVLEGKSVFDGGSDEVIRLLGDHVISVHKYKHKYPYDWRTKQPVILRATEQWFADVAREKLKALKALDQVTFIPKAGRPRLESFVKGRNEWCISRQRAWGVPIPALYQADGTAILTEQSVAHIISVINEKGIDAWWTDSHDDPSWIVPGLEGYFRRGRDTMDVWFDSGSSWTQTNGPADVYLEGTDQHRGWFQSSLLTHISASGRKDAPFKTLITHGFTLDQHGKKMSKSVGNVIAPLQIMDGSLLPPVKLKKKGVVSQALGADALRIWAASSDYTKDVVISQSALQSDHSALLKFRMILKMLLGSMHAPTPENSQITKLDQIALMQLQTVMDDVNISYHNYEFYKAIEAINKWVNTDLSAFYLEALKDRLYCGDGGGVLDEIFQGLLRMLSPITPLLVEEAWEHRPEWMKARGDAHPFHRRIDDLIIPTHRTVQDDLIAQDLPWLLRAKSAIHAALEEARANKLIGSSLESSVTLELPPSALDLFYRYIPELSSIFVVSSVNLCVAGDAQWCFSAEFEAPGAKATAFISPAKHPKCPRCWRYVAHAVDSLCRRCEDVVGPSKTSIF